MQFDSHQLKVRLGLRKEKTSGMILWVATKVYCSDCDEWYSWEFPPSVLPRPIEGKLSGMVEKVLAGVVVMCNDSRGPVVRLSLPTLQFEDTCPCNRRDLP